jgi:hypothetical protein
MNINDVIILDTPENRREWSLLRREFTDVQLEDALSRLGSRRPYPLNIAKILGFGEKLQKDMEVCTPARAREWLQILYDKYPQLRPKRQSK